MKIPEPIKKLPVIHPVIIDPDKIAVLIIYDYK